MSKLRNGQKIKIGEKTYKVIKCDGAYRRCRICQEHNGICPCINPDPTIQNATVGKQWNTKMCSEQIQNDCYLKPCTTSDK